jgi:hypothetical protein
MATNKSEQVVPVNRLNEEEAQPFYDLAWAYGASSRSNFAGDELEALVFSPSEFEAFCVALMATPPQIASVAQADWLQSDGLLYRLTDELHPENRDEINVTMADGSRSIESRARRASELLDKLSATPVVPAPVALERAHELGFLRCAGWAQRDDLFSDVTSQAYRKDRSHDLATMAAPPQAAPVAQLSEHPEIPRKQEPTNKAEPRLYKDVLLNTVYRNRHITPKGVPMKFRKKPVVIDAIQWTGSNLYEVMAFMDNAPDLRSQYAVMGWDRYTHLVAKDGLKINTLEGALMASIGDWVIKGVAGEHYPCKPDIFHTSYEPVEPDTLKDQQ